MMLLSPQGTFGADALKPLELLCSLAFSQQCQVNRESCNEDTTSDLGCRI